MYSFRKGKAKEIKKLFEECEDQVQKLQEDLAVNEEQGFVIYRHQFIVP